MQLAGSGSVELVVSDAGDLVAATRVKMVDALSPTVDDEAIHGSQAMHQNSRYQMHSVSDALRRNPCLWLRRGDR